MSDGITYGINFPFRDSRKGYYLELTENENAQIRSSLLHLLLTRKGSRYYLPDFGTRLYEFIFEPFDGLTFQSIETDIRDSVERYLPNIIINNITISPADISEETNNQLDNISGPSDINIYRFPGKGTTEYTAKIRLDFSTNRNTFAQSDFIIINI